MNGIFRPIIFVTGGAIIALELLASRIMTPYFGVSLYIWTGILSITLIALALGYYGGGLLARHVVRRRLAGDELVSLFLVMPALASLALAFACLVYPWAFYAFAAVQLVVGSFAACLLLLFVPLITTSAMNPLLVAIENAAPVAGSAREAVGDAGAGRVLFVSTAGSVAGVLVTAFALIPHLSNYSSTLLIGAVLGAISAGAPFLLHQATRHRRLVSAVGGAGLAACLGLLAAADHWLGVAGTIVRNDQVWRIERTYSSLFGAVKVLHAAPVGAPERFTRYFYQDGIVQNRVDDKGVSQTLFTYALEAIAMGYRPSAKSALMLGLGAGIVPMRLAERGVAVEIVEINPASWLAAKTHFGFKPELFSNHLDDARSFVRGCDRRPIDQRHDIVLVDLFQGDGTPEYLITRGFFADLKRCLKPGGIAVFNTFADLGELRAYAHLLATLKAEYATVMLFRGDAPAGSQINSFLLATNGPTGRVTSFNVPNLPSHLEADMNWALGRPRLIDHSDLAGGRIVTDAANFLPAENARIYMAYRRSALRAFPRPFLVN